MARKRRELAPEERDLWRRVATSVRPLGDRAVDDRAGGVDGMAAPPFSADVPLPDGASGPAAADRSGRGDAARRGMMRESVRARSFKIDPTALRTIRRGVRAIDAALDLHGLYRDEAFGALELFLAAQRAKGARVVLVVTGKGGRRAESGAADAGVGPSAPGVLRRSAPEWLSGPLAGHVAGFSPAGPRHGGDGAFYVVLRKAAGG